MSVKRLLAAGFILLGALYLRVCLPAFSEELFPAVRRMLALEQAALTLPEGVAAWLGLG